MLPPEERGFTLTAERAAQLAEILVANVQREFPAYLAHLLNRPDDLLLPRQLHPSFYGCFDWHSAVHSHWALVHLANLDLLASAEAYAVLDRHLTEENIRLEKAYFETTGRGSFERPYGWAWFLTLAGELATARTEALRHLGRNLAALEELLVGMLFQYLPKIPRPDRMGLHGNTAFSLGLIWDYAERTGRTALIHLVNETGRRLYPSGDKARFATEPGPNDFLSPALVEADLMRRLMIEEEFTNWFPAYLDGYELNKMVPVTKIDHSDGGACHLDGLNLSRAWCLRNIGEALGVGNPLFADLLAASEAHAQVGLRHVVSGHYAGEHWLPSFAIYLLRRDPLTAVASTPY